MNNMVILMANRGAGRGAERKKNFKKSQNILSKKKHIKKEIPNNSNILFIVI